MSRLPTVGGDTNNWGTILVDFLQQSLNSDGSLIRNQQVTFSRSGALTVVSGSGRYPVQQTTTIRGIQAALGTTPSGIAVIVDIAKNGASVFTVTSRPSISPTGNGSGTGSSAIIIPDITSVVQGDLLSANVVQSGSGAFPGSDLTVIVDLA